MRARFIVSCGLLGIRLSHPSYSKILQTYASRTDMLFCGTPTCMFAFFCLSAIFFFFFFPPCMPFASVTFLRVRIEMNRQYCYYYYFHSLLLYFHKNHVPKYFRQTIFYENKKKSSGKYFRVRAFYFRRSCERSGDLRDYHRCKYHWSWKSIMFQVDCQGYLHLWPSLD